MDDSATFVRSDEQVMLGATLRDMLESTVDMDRTRLMSLTDSAFDAQSWKSLCEMGVVGMSLPEVYGGLDADFTDLAVVFEEIGRVVAAVPLLSTTLAAHLIAVCGSEAQKGDLLPLLASGESIGTVAVFEQAHSIATHGLATTATPVDGGWHLTGTKRWVTDAQAADLFAVVAAVDSEVGVFLVAADDPGVAIEPNFALDATRPLAAVSFDVRLKATARLECEAAVAVDSMIDTAVVAMAQEQVGGTQRCLEMAVDYAKARYQFGRAIGSFQAVKHKCADMLVATEHARSVAWHAAMTLGTDESSIAVPLAKSVCSDAYLFAAGENIQIHGGIGFTWEHDAHLFFKRAKADSLLFGSTELHRDRLGVALGV